MAHRPKWKRNRNQGTVAAQRRRVWIRRWYRSGKPMWTDYPILELGDVPYELAPVRRVDAVEEYNPPSEKYVRATVGGVQLEMKRGYLYGTPRRV